jgi:hypothetical protein
MFSTESIQEGSRRECKSRVKPIHVLRSIPKQSDHLKSTLKVVLAEFCRQTAGNEKISTSYMTKGMNMHLDLRK